MKATAESPAHITGFFRIYRDGSTGAGINLAHGMKTTVELSAKDSFSLNGREKKDLVVSKEAVRLYRKKTGKKFRVRVLHETKFPIGYGLGISGAGALSLALALDRLMKTNLGKKGVLEIAKRAEINCGTGLGDVVAEQYAGFIMGRKPFPSRSAEILQCAEKHVVLVFYGPISTKKIIRSVKWKEKINRAGAYCMREMGGGKSMKKFVELARFFSLETGLATARIKKALEKIPDAGMAMLGETVFIPANRPEKSMKELKKYCKKTFVASIAKRGARVL